ncbi:MAG TPA: non-canonical purine NTP pyrophosphatase [Acidimicrobiales bacterium]|nr:non-canonical purine NTP pyrophosphatase [Acidimicrobiales bacterium]
MSIDVHYVTSSPYKREEIELLVGEWLLPDGRAVADVFNFIIRQVSIKEHLEIDIKTMVMAEVANAYSQLKVPCIVEHAGLVFDKYYDRGYPGGLTKPMWDTLGSDFVAETNSADAVAHARASVAYCDGMEILTFTGETRGRISPAPRGGRQFYWDTVFVPDDPTKPGTEATYAEIVENSSLGLRYKLTLSQSAKALLDFMTYRAAHTPKLWQS